VGSIPTSRANKITKAIWKKDSGKNIC
jgi:hypothetical protein